ncbi:MAG: sugar kinase [Nocardioides sp.]|uniref:PfkB family carbohydrate kinase n=1 Tax=Nocardioides sp. TaxID=35761 RepID=UPI00260E12E7|nr:PfkB family carbohydrate kinase [Nocardioides sp.]MCW2832137.1 sugar kinase [Nocardioides sp.]
MTRVIHTGQALVDVVIEVPDLPVRGQNVMATSATDYAGGAVTVLVAAARFGAACVHAGATGTGPHGDLVRQALIADGICVSADPVPGRDTGICVVLVEPSAQRTFVTTLGAERDISVESLNISKPRSGDLVCVTGFSLALESTRVPLLAWLDTLAEGVVVVLDPGSAFASLPARVREQMLRCTDVWTSNAEEAGALLSAVGRPAAGAGLLENTEALAPLMRGATVIVRDGAAGCAVLADGTTTMIPGYPQTPIDTNGAGDTHTGALLAEVAERGASWVEGCRRANAAAAIKVTRRGPTTSPTAAEVDAFLTTAD